MKQRTFTLTELLVVMGVIAVLATLTLVSMRAISAGARIASGSNTVSAALDNARALAMRRNGVVLVVFRPRLERGGSDQVVEIVTARWTGESYININLANRPVVIDRFEPVPDVPVRELPAGINVAAPRYEDLLDDAWITQSFLPATENGTEVFGGMVGVMYGPEGTTVSRLTQSDGDLIWVDFQDTPPGTVLLETPMTPESLTTGDEPMFQQFGSDETLVTVAPFLSVYDDRAARKERSTDWSAGADYDAELTGPDGYISRNGTRVHFNRYTGVVMK